MITNLKTRVLSTAAAEPSPTRAAIKSRNKLLSLLAGTAGMVAFVIFALFMSDSRLVRLGGEVTPHHHLQRSVWLVVTTAGGALGVAATALWLALWRGRSMLGRSRSLLLYGTALTPICLFAWKVLCSMVFGYPMIEWPERPGLRCLSLSLLIAIGPLLTFLAVRRTAPVRPALNGASMGVAAGACAWGAVDLWCPVAALPHLLLGHALPLCILAAIGALLGEAVLKVRHR
ncbi:MAG: DUF1109 family protein [Deltaproteobacteria bacterium]|nr:DUF1109 family protein [Deltaproteobacteria bacterium]